MRSPDEVTRRMVLNPQDVFGRYVYEPDRPERNHPSRYQSRISTIQRKSIQVLQSHHWDLKNRNNQTRFNSLFDDDASVNFVCLPRLPLYYLICDCKCNVFSSFRSKSHYLNSHTIFPMSLLSILPQFNSKLQFRKSVNCPITSIKNLVAQTSDQI